MESIIWLADIRLPPYLSRRKLQQNSGGSFNFDIVLSNLGFVNEMFDLFVVISVGIMPENSERLQTWNASSHFAPSHSVRLQLCSL